MDNYMKVFVNFILSLLCFSISSYAVIIDLGTSIGTIDARSNLVFSPLPLWVDDPQGISTATITLDTFPFQVEDVFPAHEWINITYKQSDHILTLSFSLSNSSPKGKQLEIHLRLIEEDLWTYQCGFGILPIRGAVIWDKQNQEVRDIQMDAGGWYQKIDVPISTKVTLVCEDTGEPLANAIVYIKEIVNGPEIADLAGITNTSGIADVDFTLLLTCVHSDGSAVTVDEGALDNFQLRMRVEPAPHSSLPFDPFDIIQPMRINQEIESDSLFVPVTIVVPISRSCVANSEMYK